MRRPSALAVVTAALFVTLTALAVLQYRWVGQISVAERDRMERNLRIAARQFSDAFDDETVRAVNGLRMNVTTMQEEAWNRYADRYTTWTATAEHPQIVANVYLIDAMPGTLRIRRWVNATESFDPVEWPAALSAWRPHLEAAYAAFVKREPLARTPLPDDDSLMVLRTPASPVIDPAWPMTCDARRGDAW